MGRHSKPPSQLPSRVFVAGVVVSAGLTVADSGAFQAVVQTGSAEDTAPIMPLVAVPIVPVDAPMPVGAPDLGQLPVSSNPVRDVQVSQPPAPTTPQERRAAPVPAPSGRSERASRPAAPTGVVGIARTFLGTPYRYGGKSPDAVDCSGLIYLVLKRAGLTDGYRTSHALREWVVPISRAEARPGDLVFGPGHVGIYIGNGRMIDAPKPGSSVGDRPVYSSMTSYGRIPT